MVVAAVLHVVMIAVLVMVPQHRERTTTYITLEGEPREARDLPAYGGVRAGGGPAGGVRPAAPDSGRRRAPAPPPAPAPSTGADIAPGLPPLAEGPRLGDGSMWVSPRPALPADVADAMYGEPVDKDTVLVRRLRAMVDSLNVILDSAQRDRQLPTWTTEIAGTKFGIDSQYIHVLGIKIPTAALGLLPITLPQGNYGEMDRARKLQDLRDDLMRSAQRAATLEDFRRYVKELRERKDAERDEARREREQAQDTVRAIP